MTGRWGARNGCPTCSRLIVWESWKLLGSAQAGRACESRAGAKLVANSVCRGKRVLRRCAVEDGKGQLAIASAGAGALPSRHRNGSEGFETHASQLIGDPISGNILRRDR